MTGFPVNVQETFVVNCPMFQYEIFHEAGVWRVTRRFTHSATFAVPESCKYFVDFKHVLIILIVSAGIFFLHLKIVFVFHF